MIRRLIDNSKCFIDDQEYELTTVQVRAVCQILRNSVGQQVPGPVSAEADIDTTNPELIIKLFDACYANKRINLRIEEALEVRSTSGLIIADASYNYSNGTNASFQCRAGSEIKFMAKGTETT